MTTTAVFVPATDAQLRFAHSLLQTKDIPVAGRTYDEAQLIARAEDIMGGKDVSKRETSRVIDWLKGLPRKAQEPQVRPAEAHYIKGDDVYVVVPNKTNTAVYAKHLEIYTTSNGAKRGRWTYAPRVAQQIVELGLTPLTVTEAARLGHMHGVCVACGATLDKPESSKRGIGPVCASKLGA